jgi:AcrR family transcriptional regulator
MSLRSASTRRTEGVRTRGRSARIVDGVLRATAAELGRVGYAALRIEDVAARSRVNKTTIYRRWPTKQDLVAATVASIHIEEPLPDTGSIEGDLAEIAWQLVRKTRNPLSRGLIRMIQVERGDPEVDALARRLRAERLGRLLPAVERAIARRELPPATDARLLIELVTSAVMNRILRTGEPVDEPFVRAVVAVVVAGARAGGAVPPRAPS